MKEIKNRIKELNKIISDSEKEKSKLEKQLIINEKDPIKKFIIWWESEEDNDEDDWVPDREKFPLLRDWIDSFRDYNRYETIDLNEELLDNFAWAIYNDEYSSVVDIEDEETQEEAKIRYKKLAQELIKGKLKCFKYDW